MLCFFLSFFQKKKKVVSSRLNILQNTLKMAKSQALVVKTPDSINFDQIMKIQCQPTLTCPRLVAIYNHMETFYNDRTYSITDFDNAKKTFTEEFWVHAPGELKYWRDKMLEDPINHKSIAKYDVLLKLYKYSIQNPLHRFPDNFEDKISEQQRICFNVMQGSWGNFE